MAQKTTDSEDRPATKHSMTGRILLALGAVLLFLLMLLPVGYFALRSPLLYERLSPELAARLEPMGIALEQPGSLQVDLLRGLHLRDLQLQWHDAEIGDIELTVGELIIEYAMAPLLRRQLVIRSATLKDVDIIASLPPSAAPGPDAAGPLDLAQWDALLRSPPLPLRIEHLALENIHFDMRQGNETQWQRIQGQLQLAKGSLDWQPEQLQGALKLSLDDTAGDWQLSQHTPAGTDRLVFAPGLDSKLNWALSRNPQGWKLQQARLDHRLTLQHPKLRRHHAGSEKTLGKSAQLTLTARTSASSVPGQHSGQGLLAIFPLDLDADVDATVQRLTLNDFSQDDLHLDLLADQRFTLTASGRLEPFTATPPPLTFSGTQTLDIDHLDLTLPGQQTQIRQLALNLDASGEAPMGNKARSPLTFRLDLDGQAAQVRFRQQDDGEESEALDASLAPTLSIKASGQLQNVNNWQQDLNLHVEPQLTGNDLDIRLGTDSGSGHDRYHISSARLSASGDLRQGRLQLSTDLDLAGANIPQLAREFSLDNALTLNTDLQLSHPRASLEVTLDQRQLANLEITASNDDGELALQHLLTTTLTSRLQKLLPAASALQQTGDLNLVWQGDTKLPHGASDVRTADFSRFNQWPLAHEATLELTQTKPPKGSDGIVLKAPARLRYSVSKADDYHTALHLKAPSFRIAALQKPVPLALSHQGTFDWPLSRANGSASLRIADTDAIAVQLSARNRPRRLTLDSRWSVNLRPQWKAYLPALAALDSSGPLNGAHWLKGNITHPYHSILDFDPARLNALSAELTLDSQLTQPADQAGMLLQLDGPINLTQVLDWSTRKADIKTDFTIADATASQQFQLRGLRGQFHLLTNSGLLPSGGQLDFQLTDGTLQLLEHGTDQTTAANLEEAIIPLDLTLAARQQDEHVLLQRLRLRAGGDFIELEASGEASLDGGNAQLEGLLTTRLRPDLLINPYLGGAGEATLPWQLVWLDGRQLSVDGEMRFDYLDITTKAFQLQGLEGSMNIEEELVWTGNQLKFRYLEDSDPFQRVDFSRIQPFLENRDNLQIESISVGERTLGPALASLDVKQNIVHLQRLDLELFGGHLTGQLYLDARPGAWTVGLLSRITELDPRKLLPRGHKSKEERYTPITMRTAIEFDIQQRLLQGRIDITRISREQLFQLLEVIDPDYQDEQLAALRSALRLAHPQRLSLEMQQGLLNLDVTISALASPLRLRGLPLTPLIQHFGGAALKQLSKLPLE